MLNILTQAATLRVLSYTSPSFEQLCQPRMLRQVIIVIIIIVVIVVVVIFIIMPYSVAQTGE